MVMHRKTPALAALLAVAFLAGPALAECEPGAKIDWARKKAETAGYRQLKGWRKGCDSVWHAEATKAGTPVRLLVTPQGQVMEEGN
jgi:hypothetical protein